MTARLSTAGLLISAGPWRGCASWCTGMCGASTSTSQAAYCRPGSGRGAYFEAVREVLTKHLPDRDVRELPRPTASFAPACPRTDVP
jgi:hypothetical protein